MPIIVTSSIVYLRPMPAREKKFVFAGIKPGLPVQKATAFSITPLDRTVQLQF